MAVLRTWIFAVSLVVLAPVGAWGDLTVVAEQKISHTEGSLGVELLDGQWFGSSLAHLGDLDGDGFEEVAAGIQLSDLAGNNRGMVWILSLNDRGEVVDRSSISSSTPALIGRLDDGDLFGHAVAALGDLDGNGVTDLAVGAIGDDDGGDNAGAVWILFLQSDRTVLAAQPVSGGHLPVPAGSEFGSSVAALGDVDGDGVTDLAVGAINDTDGGSRRGAVWVVLLSTAGEVRGHQKISATAGGFTGRIDASDTFGASVAAPGDLDGNHSADLLVGAPLDDDGGANRGALWVLFLDAQGRVLWQEKVSDLSGVDDRDFFAWSLVAQPSPDGAWVAAGANFDDDGGPERGAVWLLELSREGAARVAAKIASGATGFGGPLSDGDQFGAAVAFRGSVTAARLDLLVGAARDDDGGHDRGALWALSMVDDSLPIAVLGLQARLVDGAVQLSWCASGDDSDVEVWRRSPGWPAVRLDVRVERDRSLGCFRAVDTSALPGRDYVYRLILGHGSAAVEAEATVTTSTSTAWLGRNHPNPFNPVTTIPLRGTAGEPARLSIVDAAGRSVRVFQWTRLPAGTVPVRWDGTDARGRPVASGVYGVHLKTGRVRRSSSIVLLR